MVAPHNWNSHPQTFHHSLVGETDGQTTLEATGRAPGALGREMVLGETRGRGLGPGVPRRCRRCLCHVALIQFWSLGAAPPK